MTTSHLWGAQGVLLQNSDVITERKRAGLPFSLVTKRVLIVCGRILLLIKCSLSEYINDLFFVYYYHSLLLSLGRRGFPGCVPFWNGWEKMVIYKIASTTVQVCMRPPTRNHSRMIKKNDQKKITFMTLCYQQMFLLKSSNEYTFGIAGMLESIPKAWKKWFTCIEEILSMNAWVPQNEIVWSTRFVKTEA